MTPAGLRRNKVCTPKFYTGGGQILTFPTKKLKTFQNTDIVTSCKLHAWIMQVWLDEGMPANMHLFFCLQRSKAPGDATSTPKVVGTQDSQAEASRISLVQLIFLFPFNSSFMSRHSMEYFAPEWQGQQKYNFIVQMQRLVGCASLLSSTCARECGCGFHDFTRSEPAVSRGHLQTYRQV